MLSDFWLCGIECVRLFPLSLIFFKGKKKDVTGFATHFYHYKLPISDCMRIQVGDVSRITWALQSSVYFKNTILNVDQHIPSKSEETPFKQ